MYSQTGQYASGLNYIEMNRLAMDAVGPITVRQQPHSKQQPT